MLIDMKEHMREQYVQSDHDRKQAALDRDNAVREQEALKQHNDQLQEQIAAFQKISVQTQPEDEHWTIGDSSRQAHHEAEAV